MSTEYGFHCRTCGITSGMAFRNDLLSAQSVIGIAPLIVRAIEMEYSGLLEAWIVGDYEGAFLFALKHCGEGHDLIVEDEYGTLYGADGSMCGENKKDIL